MASACFVCHTGISERYSEWKWEIWGKTYRLSKCPACGSFFTDPLPDNATLRSLYEKSFDYRWYRDHYDAKLRDCRMRIREYQNIMGRKVLDFGGGIGYFSQVAREMGFDSTTFDPFYNKEAGIDGKWDTLVALHVLEHSNDPDSLIEQIKNFLKPGGRLILAVPNALSTGYKKLGMHWVWAQPPLLHVFHFTAAGLKSLLKRHDFQNLKITYHERWDANIHSDVKNVRLSNMMDALWSKRPFNSFSYYRKLVAAINSFRRFDSLKKALKGYDPDNESYAELQIIALNSEAHDDEDNQLV